MISRTRGHSEYLEATFSSSLQVGRAPAHRLPLLRRKPLATVSVASWLAPFSGARLSLCTANTLARTHAAYVGESRCMPTIRPIKVSMRLVRGREVLLAGRHGCGVVQRPASPGRGWGGGGEACGASVHEAQPGARSQYFCPTLRFIIHVVVCASRQLDTWLDVAGAAVVACVSRTDVESDRKRNTAVNGADELDGADLSK